MHPQVAPAKAAVRGQRCLCGQCRKRSPRPEYPVSKEGQRSRLPPGRPPFPLRLPRPPVPRCDPLGITPQAPLRGAGLGLGGLQVGIVAVSREVPGEPVGDHLVVHVEAADRQAGQDAAVTVTFIEEDLDRLALGE